MKKLILIAVLASFVAVSAGANSINVPFWRDNAQLYPPQDTGGGQPRYAGFIGLKNTTGTDIQAEVEYADPSGNPDIPSPNSFTIVANAAISWRPFRDDVAIEGPAGNAVPDASLVPAGAATILWYTGSITDVQGRYVEIGSDSTAFSYLLPQGVAK